MCRCLGLAIMKHLENGKGKQHISDLMNLNENFTFFNSLYNSNMEFLFNFFDKNKNFSDEQISNLDKLENKLNSENKNYVNDIDNLFINDKPISYVHHFKNKNDDELIKESNKSKLHGIQEIEKDIKFIDEFFSMGRKQIKNYQNISEKSKNVLIKDLSYIGEVDSELQYSKINGSKINSSNKENKNEENKNEDNKNEDDKNENDDNDENDESKYDEFEYMENEEVDDKNNKRLSDSKDEKNNDKKSGDNEDEKNNDKKSDNEEEDNKMDKKSDNEEEDNKIDKKSENKEDNKIDKKSDKNSEKNSEKEDEYKIDKKSEENSEKKIRK